MTERLMNLVIEILLAHENTKLPEYISAHEPEWICCDESLFPG
jgi:hypothetical protein